MRAEIGLYKFYEMLGLLIGAPRASLRPIFPKHTLLQNKTLAIQVMTPMLSLLIRPLLSERLPCD